MVSFGVASTVFALILCTSLSCVWSLQCYECTSILDPKCGKTWGYEGDKEGAKKYLKTCEGTTVACQKLENEGVKEGHAVSRKCWSSDSVEFYTPKAECEEMHNGMVCYCKGEGDDPCNGKQLVQPQIATVLLGLFFFVLRLVL